MKVAWICHFSNSEIQKVIHPGYNSREYAPWITHLIKLLEEDKRFELFIIAPHGHVKGIIEERIKGVNYFFFNPEIRFFRWSLLDLLNINIKTNYFRNRRIIGTITKRIKPDIIHLHGAENAYYSSSIFQYRGKYPVLITIQGFISFTSENLDPLIRKRFEVEKGILKAFKHFGYRTEQMKKDILLFNPEAKLHWHHYPVPEIKPKDTIKVFDIVFFARLNKDKGIEDLLEAVGILIVKRPFISVCIIGEDQNEYGTFLKRKAEKLKISNNITWAGYLRSQKNVYEMASMAKTCVLPTYNDIISGTIIESLFLKIPVVAYDTGSIKEVNHHSAIISLVQRGDISGLTREIDNILHNPDIAEKKKEEGYKRVVEMFDNRKIKSDLIIAYENVIDDFKISK